MSRRSIIDDNGASKWSRKRLSSHFGNTRSIHFNRWSRLVPTSKFETMAEVENLESGKFYMLGRDLANTEKSVRDGAVDAIRRYLFHRLNDPIRELTSLQDATELEMMKLWKGLFYTFWMSDKPPVQEALAQLLTDMVCFGKNG